MEMDNCLVSVIMPSYNAEKTIGRAIASVLNQSYSNFELIIVNDGSKDKTADVANSFHDERIRLVNQLNTGLSGARNSGLACARGSYVTFIDSDDWYDVDFLNHLVNSVIANHAQLVVCGIVSHKLDSDTTSAIFESIYDTFFDNIEFLSIFESGIMNSVCNKIYDANIVRNNNLLFENVEILEDLKFNLFYLKYVKRVAFIPKHLYHYDNSFSVLSTKVSRKMFDNYIHLHAWLLSEVPVDCFSVISDFIYHQYMALCVRFLSVVSVDEKKKAEIFEALDFYISNPLLQHSFKYHKSKYVGEKLITRLLMYKQFYLVMLYLKLR